MVDFTTSYSLRMVYGQPRLIGSERRQYVRDGQSLAKIRNKIRTRYGRMYPVNTWKIPKTGQDNYPQSPLASSTAMSRWGGLLGALKALAKTPPMERMSLGASTNAERCIS